MAPRSMDDFEKKITNSIAPFRTDSGWNAEQGPTGKSPGFESSLGFVDDLPGDFE